MASTELIEKFRQVVAEDYGRKISVEEAEKMLADLTAYFDLLAKLQHRSVEGSEENNYI